MCGLGLVLGHIWYPMCCLGLDLAHIRVAHMWSRVRVRSFMV